MVKSKLIVAEGKPSIIVKVFGGLGQKEDSKKVLHLASAHTTREKDVIR